MRSFDVFFCLVLGISASACGGDDAADPPGNPGAGAMGGSGGSGGSSGTGGGGAGGSGTGGSGAGGSGATGGSGGTGGIPEDLLGDGFIVVEQRSADYRLLAMFDAWDPEPLCGVQDHGPCRIEVCILATLHRSAGRVGASSGSSEISMSPLGENYEPVFQTGILWSAGAPVRLFAEGADAPAIDETVTGPGAFAVTAPSLAAPLAIDRSQDIEFRWSGGQGSSAVLAVAGRAAGGQDVQIKCSFDGALGQGAIPSSALSILEPSSTANLIAFAEGYRSLVLERWLIRVAARTEMLTAQVTYQ
jgi:hypothetical protein